MSRQQFFARLLAFAFMTVMQFTCNALLPPPPRRTSLRLSYCPSDSTYEGPRSAVEEMVVCEEVPGLGVRVMVGPSKTAPGLGLFLSLADDQEHPVKVARGTQICAYHPGTFTDDPSGDKTVAFSLRSPAAGVIFHNQLSSLSDVIATFTNDDMSDKDLHAILAGHFVEYNEETGSMEINPDDGDDDEGAEWFPRYFVPDMDSLSLGAGAGAGLGVFANDLAYEGTHTSTHASMNKKQNPGGGSR